MNNPANPMRIRAVATPSATGVHAEFERAADKSKQNPRNTTRPIKLIRVGRLPSVWMQQTPDRKIRLESIPDASVLGNSWMLRDPRSDDRQVRLNDQHHQGVGNGWMV